MSAQAARTAGDVGRHFGARVHVLRVSAPGGDGAAGMDAAVAGLGPGVHAIERTARGVPARCIVEYAAQASIDVIVIGTHGRTGVSQACSGA